MYLISKVWEYSLNTERVFGVILLTGGTILTGIVVYIVLGMILNIEEVDIVKRAFKRTFKFITST
jgi:phage shock protein PspC (stress-responsive transcriptional regulator)